MKKKILSLLMATCMVAMVLTGCTEKETSADGEKASVEESKEDEKEESEEAEESTEEAEETESFSISHSGTGNFNELFISYNVL